jgi:Rrf2 family protein
MLRLSKKADYALIAMNHLARRQGSATASTSARDIAERYDIPIELMAKVLQRLVRTGLLVSTQGTRGGYMLSRPSGSISVADVVQAIDGPFTVTACSTEKHDCGQYSKCNVRGPLWQIRERIVAALGTVSLAEMSAESEPAPAAVELAVVRRSGLSGSAGHGPRQG